MMQGVEIFLKVGGLGIEYTLKLLKFLFEIPSKERNRKAEKVKNELSKLKLLELRDARKIAKMKGVLSVNNMLLKFGGETQVVQFCEEDKKEFISLAKKYGITYAELPDLNTKDGMKQVLVATEQLDKLQIILDTLSKKNIERNQVKLEQLEAELEPIAEQLADTEKQVERYKRNGWDQVDERKEKYHQLVLKHEYLKKQATKLQKKIEIVKKQVADFSSFEEYTETDQNRCVEHVDEVVEELKHDVPQGEIVSLEKVMNDVPLASDEKEELFCCIEIPECVIKREVISLSNEEFEISDVKQYKYTLILDNTEKELFFSQPWTGADTRQTEEFQGQVQEVLNKKAEELQKEGYDIDKSRWDTFCKQNPEELLKRQEYAKKNREEKKQAAMLKKQKTKKTFDELHEKFSKKCCNIEKGLNHHTENDYSSSAPHYLFDLENPDTYIKITSSREEDFNGKEYTKSLYEVYHEGKQQGIFSDEHVAGWKAKDWLQLRDSMEQMMGHKDYDGFVMLYNTKAASAETVFQTYQENFHLMKEAEKKPVKVVEIENVVKENQDLKILEQEAAKQQQQKRMENVIAFPIDLKKVEKSEREKGKYAVYSDNYEHFFEIDQNTYLDAKQTGQVHLSQVKEVCVYKARKDAKEQEMVTTLNPFELEKEFSPDTKKGGEEMWQNTKERKVSTGVSKKKEK